MSFTTKVNKIRDVFEEYESGSPLIDVLTHAERLLGIEVSRSSVIERTDSIFQTLFVVDTTDVHDAESAAESPTLEPQVESQLASPASDSSPVPIIAKPVPMITKSLMPKTREAAETSDDESTEIAPGSPTEITRRLAFGGSSTVASAPEPGPLVPNKKTRADTPPFSLGDRVQAPFRRGTEPGVYNGIISRVQATTRARRTRATRR